MHLIEIHLRDIYLEVKGSKTFFTIFQLVVSYKSQGYNCEVGVIIWISNWKEVVLELFIKFCELCAVEVSNCLWLVLRIAARDSQRRDLA